MPFNTQMKLMCEMCISEVPIKNQSEETEGAEWGYNASLGDWSKIIWHTVERLFFFFLLTPSIIFPSRRGLHQIRPPGHHCHGNSSESGGGACSGQGGQTDSAGEQAARATKLTLERPTGWHFRIVLTADSLQLSGKADGLKCGGLSYRLFCT